NRAVSICLSHFWMKEGSPASKSRSLLFIAAASCCGSRFERTTIQVSLEGDCRMGRNIAGCGSSARFGVYFPSSTIPTTCVRVPSRLLKYRPMAFATEPKILRANSWLITATRGPFLSSCHVRSLPANKAVLAAWKYSGETLYITGLAAAFDGLRSVVSSVKTIGVIHIIAVGGY